MGKPEVRNSKSKTEEAVAGLHGSGNMDDIQLYRARLFYGVTPYPWDKDEPCKPRGTKGELATARRLIEQCGYWHRKEGLEDAEEAAKNWEEC